MAKSKYKATVFIPTFNGEKYLAQIIDAIYSQIVDFDYELLIIDSGSTDGTLPIVALAKNKYPNLRLEKIPNEAFGHGKTRNLAAQMSQGEIIVYLSHDAIPSHSRWLYEITKPFDINEKIVAVMGKQIPRQNCFPLLKYEIESVFSGFGPEYGTVVFYKDSFMENNGFYDAAAFYSDVNSAARRTSLLGPTPYRDVRYAEDQLLGRDVLNAGLMKVYAPRASVIHSNDLRLREYKKRMFDETLALRSEGISEGGISWASMLRSIARGTINDQIKIIKDSRYSVKRKLYWLVINPFYQVEKWRGVYTALNVDVNDDEVRIKHSLEQQIKSRRKTRDLD